MIKQGTPTHPSYRDTLRARKPFHFFRNGLVLVALGLFAGAAALAVVKPAEEPVVYQARETLVLPQLSPLTASNDPAPFVSETTIRRGDTLAALLQRLQVSEPGLQQFLIQEEDARSIYKLYPGRVIQAALDANGSLVWLRYRHTPGTSAENGYAAKWLEITPDGEGGFLAAEVVDPAQTHMRIAEGVIESSLFGAADEAGIPDGITLEMADILGSKIDFLRDIRKGDRFRLVYETYSHEGLEVGAGKILALEFINDDTRHEAVWFAPEGESGGYYDFEGKSLRGAFLRSALKVSRISSTFGLRKHPIHGSFKAHNGVDYAAPTGTPIFATGDGTIDFIGNQRGYGKTTVIRHRNNITTLFAHQSRFAAGLKKGSKVSQGQLIGYVGSTGWSTGPHLHYEFRVNNKPVDPLAVDLPVARSLEDKHRPAFQAAVAQFRPHIEFLAEYQRQEQAAEQVASR